MNEMVCVGDVKKNKDGLPTFICEKCKMVFDKKSGLVTHERQCVKGLNIKPSADELEERRNKVFELRLEGMSFERIAYRLGTNSESVRKDWMFVCKENLEKLKRINIEEVIALDLAKREYLEKKILEEAKRLPIGLTRLSGLKSYLQLLKEKKQYYQDVGLLPKMQNSIKNVEIEQKLNILMMMLIKETKVGKEIIKELKSSEIEDEKSS